MRRRAVLAAALLASAFVLTAGTANCRPAWKCLPPTPRPSATQAPTLGPSPTPTIIPTPSPASSSGFALDEEFDGTALNSRWVPLFGPGDPGYLLDTDTMANLSQASVSGGVATITVERKTTPSGRPFAGAVMATYGAFGQRFGTWEARLRYDEAKGTWPSFFMIPVGQKNPYPEIDNFEAYGDAACLGPGYVVQSVHYAGETVSDYKVVPVSSSSGFHVHKLVWTSSAVTFSIDGAVTFTTSAHVPQVAMYPIFAYGVGANSPACRADATTPSPLHMNIDYLRISP